MDQQNQPDLKVSSVFGTDGVNGREQPATDNSTEMAPSRPTEMAPSQPSGMASSRIPFWLLVTGMGLPTLVTWIYFDVLSQSDRMVQQTAYVIGKGSQLVLPFLAWWMWRKGWDRGLPSRETADPGPTWMRPFGSAAGGVLLGGIIAASMILLYFLWLEPQGVMSMAKVEGEAKLRSLGIDSPWLLIALALFYAVLHSGFEEFYWRRFIFCGLTTHGNWWLALVGSSLAFMAHHVLVLARFFGWMSPWTYLFALAVAVGGGIWATQVWYSRNWIFSWISHGIVDAAIFLIALRLIYGS